MLSNQGRRVLSHRPQGLSLMQEKGEGEEEEKKEEEEENEREKE